MIKLPQQSYQPDSRKLEAPKHTKPAVPEQKNPAPSPAPAAREKKHEAPQAQNRPPTRPSLADRPLPPGPPPPVHPTSGLHPTDMSKKFSDSLGDRGHTHGFRNLLLTLVVLAALVGTGLAVTGLYDVPYLSAKFGTNTQRDLGVATSPEALHSFQQKIPMTISGPAFDYGFVDPKKIFTGTIAVEIDTTSEEFSSWLERFQGAHAPVKNIRVNILESELEFAGIVDRYVKSPIYLKATVAVTSPTSIDLTVTEGQLGTITLPAWALQKIERSFEQKINDRMSSTPNFSIEILEYHDGFSKFKGTLPANASPSEDGWWALFH